jgi:hypothetical protein
MKHQHFSPFEMLLPLKMGDGLACRLQRSVPLGRFSTTISFRTAYEGENADPNIQDATPLAGAFGTDSTSGTTNQYKGEKYNEE